MIFPFSRGTVRTLLRALLSPDAALLRALNDARGEAAALRQTCDALRAHVATQDEACERKVAMLAADLARAESMCGAAIETGCADTRALLAAIRERDAARAETERLSAELRRRG